jgi:hypothetical protein
MSFLGPRLPRPPSQEALHHKQREVEADLELRAQLHAAREERTDSIRGIRAALRRVRDAMRRHVARSLDLTSPAWLKVV